MFDRLGETLDSADDSDAVTMQSASGKITITGLGNAQLKRKLTRKPIQVHGYMARFCISKYGNK